VAGGASVGRAGPWPRTLPPPRGATAADRYALGHHWRADQPELQPQPHKPC